MCIRILFHTIKILSISTALILAAACGNSESSNSTVETDASEARTIFTQNCISCHGTDLKGRVGGNSDLTKVGARLSEEEIRKQIADGGSGMIPFKKRITSEEIRLLAEWLAAKK